MGEGHKIKAAVELMLSPSSANHKRQTRSLMRSWMDIEKIRIGRSGGKEGRKPTIFVMSSRRKSESIGGPIIELEEGIRIAARKFHAVQEYSDNLTLSRRIQMHLLA